MEDESPRVRDISDVSYRTKTDAPAKVRTQIYLTEQQRDFLNREGKRQGLSMAEVIRQYIDEKMNPKEDIWDENPLLAETPVDPEFEGHENGSTATDAIIYGAVSE